MKCEILSNLTHTIECIQISTFDCADCTYAWNYMGLNGPGSYLSRLQSYEIRRVNNDLVGIVMFNDGDPTKYICRIHNGEYYHFDKQDQFPQI